VGEPNETRGFGVWLVTKHRGGKSQRTASEQVGAKGRSVVDEEPNGVYGALNF